MNYYMILNSSFHLIILSFFYLDIVYEMLLIEFIILIIYFVLGYLVSMCFLVCLGSLCGILCRLGRFVLLEMLFLFGFMNGWNCFFWIRSFLIALLVGGSFVLMSLLVKYCFFLLVADLGNLNLLFGLRIIDIEIDFVSCKIFINYCFFIYQNDLSSVNLIH